jgi:hypothetical protein
MFKFFKSALGLHKENNDPASQRSSLFNFGRSGGGSQLDKVSEWATLQGLTYTEGSKGYAVDGKILGRPWKIEQGKPSRDFIKGIELRARGEMGVNEDVAVMIMSRQLKNDLDKRAFSLYTDTLQTQVNPHLPEEMRWLSMYDEVGWEQLAQEFLDEYAILADERGHAVAWLKEQLIQLLQTWPSKEAGVPRVLMVLRGKVYLRMQINEEDLPTLEHASRVFTAACECAIAAFSKNAPT